jgi:hypothetical protein
MFDFLKKKLKLFEKNIEAEIESELKKEAKLEKRLHEEQPKQPIPVSSPVKPVQTKPEAPVIKEEAAKPVITRKRALRAHKPVSEEKKERGKASKKR